jgi:hypothetical protein
MNQIIKKVQIVTILLFSLMLINCSSTTPKEEAKFKVINITLTTSSCGYLHAKITIENIGNKEGHNVCCKVEAKKDGDVVETVWAYFCDGGSIYPGEYAIGYTTYFYHIYESEDYDTLTAELFWDE